MPRPPLAFPLALVAVGAGGGAGCAVGPAPGPVVVEAHSAGCPSEERACAHVLLAFPDAAGASPLNGAIEGWLRETLGAFDRPSADSVSQAFLRDWERETGQVGSEYARNWFLERTVERSDPFASVVVLTMSEMVYTGGAHPMTRQRHQAFDAGTGARLGLDHWIRPDSHPGVRSLLDTQFREDRRLLGDASGTAESVDWDRAPLDNLAPGPDGLSFHFDPYEIAPYAVGPIRITLAWGSLAPFLTEAATDLLRRAGAS